MTTRIETARFFLRDLTEADVTPRYLHWFTDPDARANISVAKRTQTLEDLRAYVVPRLSREDILFLAIVDKASGLHIGNVKYEPVDRARGYAVMGLLIGEPAFRGRGVATEVLTASGEWLREQHGIRQIVLGVHRDNVAAIRAYEHVGYRVERTALLPHLTGDALSMVWTL